jgi:hypothetical protein
LPSRLSFAAVVFCFPREAMSALLLTEIERCARLDG